MAAGDRWFVFTDSPNDKSIARPATPPPASALPKTGIEADEDRKNRIRKFVIAHHQKPGAGSINQLEQDYAEMVDFLGNSKTVDEIMNDERRYHKEWSSVTANIITPITVMGDETDFRVSYTVEYRTESLDGRWALGKNDIQLTVRAVDDELKIVRQTSKVYDKSSGGGEAEKTTIQAPTPPSAQNPPRIKSVALTVPVPRWMMSVRSPGDPTLEITDVLHLSGNQFMLHRTFRRLSSDGKTLLAECRAKYDGSYRSNGRQISLYLGSQGWEKGGDPQLARQVAPQVERMVGHHLELAMEADGSITIAGAGKMRQLK